MTLSFILCAKCGLCMYVCICTHTRVHSCAIFICTDGMAIGMCPYVLLLAIGKVHLGRFCIINNYKYICVTVPCTTISLHTTLKKKKSPVEDQTIMEISLNDNRQPRLI